MGYTRNVHLLGMRIHRRYRVYKGMYFLRIRNRVVTCSSFVLTLLGIMRTYICVYDNNYMYKLYYISNVHIDKILILYMYMDIIVY